MHVFVPLLPPSGLLLLTCTHIHTPPTLSTTLPNHVHYSRGSAVIKMERVLGARHATLPVLQH